MLNLQSKFIYIGIILLCIVVSIFIFGLHERTVGRDNYIASMAKVQVKYNASTKKVTTEVVIKYVDRIVVVKEKGDTIIKKVPVYVNVKDDSKCTINNGFVRLWNSANQMSVPGTASSANGSPSEVVLSDVASQHIKEATICTGTETQLNSLQDWVRQQQALTH